MLDADRLRDAFERVVPNPEAATMKSRKSGALQATFTDHAISNVRLKRLTKEQAQVVGGEVAHKYRVLQVWQRHLDEVSAPDPKVADEWVCEGSTYVVDRVLEHKLMGEVWNLLVLKA